MLWQIAAWLMHKSERLPFEEMLVQQELVSEIAASARTTRKPVVIGMVGLVGAGKSTVARKLADSMGAAVIEGDAVREALRSHGRRYDNARLIMEGMALALILQEKSAIIDADFIEPLNRARLQNMLKGVASPLFVRVWCNYDIMAGRILQAEYPPQSFFGGARSQWEGEHKGNVIKLREMWRRTPLHYRWIRQDGGKWMLRNLRFDVAATINTAEELGPQLKSVFGALPV